MSIKIDTKHSPNNFNFPKEVKHLINYLQFHCWPESTTMSILVTLVNGHQVTEMTRPMKDENFDIVIGMETLVERVTDKLFEIRSYEYRRALSKEKERQQINHLPSHGSFQDGSSYPSDK